MNTFNDIYVFDLHGSSKKKQKSPQGGEDNNVFDIQQGVAISFFIKQKGKVGPAAVHHAELWGTREEKYSQLAENEIASMDWQELKPHSPYYFFIRRSEKYGKEYSAYWKINDVFPVNQSAIVTARDGFAVAIDKKMLQKRIEIFIDKTNDDSTVENMLHLKENYAWRILEARKELMNTKNWEKYYAKYLYRPFDIRHIFYHPSVVWRTRNETMEHMRKSNLALSTTRSIEIGRFEHIFCTREMMDHHAVSLKEINYLFPLYLYPDGKLPKLLFDHEDGRRPNLSSELVDYLTSHLRLSFIPDGCGDLKKTIGSEDIFHYTYAVFHSPTYRTRYAEFLKIDFPRCRLPAI